MIPGTIPGLFEEKVVELCKVTRDLVTLRAALAQILRRPDGMDEYDLRASADVLEAEAGALYSCAQQIRAMRNHPEPHSVYCNELE